MRSTSFIFSLLRTTAVALLVTAHGLAAPGDVDPGFNSGSGPVGFARAAAVLPDGRVIVVGSFAQYEGVTRRGVLRLFPNGTLDPSFDPDAGPGNGAVRDAAVLPDGRTLVSGGFGVFNNVPQGFLVRLQANGSVDESFNAQLLPGNGLSPGVDAIWLQPDGMVIIAGSFRLAGETTARSMARLRADGTVDPGFSTAINLDSSLCVALLPEGRFLIAGSAADSGGTIRSGLLRLRRDGSLDEGFAPATAELAPHTLVVQPDGKILFANYQGTRRLLPDGAADPEWIGSGGAYSGTVYTCALQVNGKVLLGGILNTAAGSADLVRLNRNGTLDTGFRFGKGNAPVSSFVMEHTETALISGFFNTFNDTSRLNFARIFVGEPASTAPSVIGFAWGAESVAEEAGVTRIAVVRTGGNESSVDVSYSVAAGTADDADFTASSGTVTFAPGESLKTIEVTFVSDRNTEADETFSLTLSAPIGATLSIASTTVTIADDDKSGRFEVRPVVSLVSEATWTQVLKVSRAGDTLGNVSVDHSTAQGTANHADFMPLMGTLQFADGENDKTVLIPLVPDAKKDGKASLSGLRILPAALRSVLTVSPG